MAHRADGLNDIFEHNVTIRDSIKTNSGTIQEAPINDKDIVNKAYVDNSDNLKVPYTGANQDIDLNSKNINTGNLTVGNRTIPANSLFNGTLDNRFELIEDATLTNSSNWILGPGWTVSAGSMVHAGTGAGHVNSEVLESSPATVENGATYLISISVSVNQNGLTITFGGNNITTFNIPASTGTLTKLFTTSSTANLSIKATGGGNETITAISIKKMQNANFGNVAITNTFTTDYLSITGAVGNPPTNWILTGGKGSDGLNSNGAVGANWTAGAGAGGIGSVGYTGGKGGDTTLSSGNGGNGTLAGSAGNAIINAGIKGSGFGAAVNGHIIFKSGGTEIGRWDNTTGAVGNFRLTLDNQKIQLGTAQDVFINYTGTVWNFDVAAATTEIVFNNSSFDTDFRIEGNGDANLFFCDAGNDRVGIGMNNPAYKLDVTGDTNVSGVYRVGGAAGLTVVITTAAITPGGATGTMTFTGGILTAQTQAT